jgi:hypothetical protein
MDARLKYGRSRGGMKVEGASQLRIRSYIVTFELSILSIGHNREDVVVVCASEAVKGCSVSKIIGLLGQT